MKTRLLLTFALLVAFALSVSHPVRAGAAAAPAPLRILLLAGGCCHDYVNQPIILKDALEARANVVVDIVYSTPTPASTAFALFSNPDWAKGYDLILHDECSADVTDATIIQNILNVHAQGVPAVFLHCAMHSYRTAGWNAGAVTPWFELTGLQSSGHGAQLPIALNFVDKENEITKGFANWTTANEELYNNYAGGVLPTARPLVLGRQGADETVVVWTNIYKQKARVFASTLGHNNTTVQDPRYLDMVTRGLLWAANKLDSNYLKPAPKGQVLLSPLPVSSEEVGAEATCSCQGDLAAAE